MKQNNPAWLPIAYAIAVAVGITLGAWIFRAVAG